VQDMFPGMSSEEGSSGEFSCFDCLPCPLGKTSRAQSGEASGCFEWNFIDMDLYPTLMNGLFMIKRMCKW
jgi:hypothetical protein